MKKLVTLVIWILAILVGGIYMTFPSSKVVRDATKVEKIQEDIDGKDYVLYLPDGSSEEKELQESENKSEELHRLVQAELDYLYEKEVEGSKIELRNIYVTEDGVYILCTEKPKKQSLQAIAEVLKQLEITGKVQVL